MVSHHVQTDRLFYIPFQSRTDGSALVVDIPISWPNGESEHAKRILRLCTTHFDRPREAGQEESRPRQLAQVSALLNGTHIPSSEINSGLVGGAMDLDAATHTAVDVELCDVSEDTADPSTPFLETLERLKELKRNTWGYQVPKECSARRLSKFFCTGMAGMVPLLELQDWIGKIGRLGIGVKTKVNTWEDDIEPLDTLSRALSSRKSHSDAWREVSVRKELIVPVSNYFAIAIRIRDR